MLEPMIAAVSSQFFAVLAMFNECLEKCPEEHWDDIAAKYPFWLVAYHTLYCTDLYLSKGDDAFQLRSDFHPGGASDLEDEYPSKRFTKSELLAYTQVIKAKAEAEFADETVASLLADSGFKGRNLSRLEVHIYSTRHIAHHTGQLSTLVRRAGGEPGWVSRGWK